MLLALIAGAAAAASSSCAHNGTSILALNFDAIVATLTFFSQPHAKLHFLLDAQRPATIETSTAGCQTHTIGYKMVEKGKHILAAYLESASGSVELLYSGEPHDLSAEEIPDGDTVHWLKEVPNALPVFSTYYTTINTDEALAHQAVSQNLGVPGPNVEDVVRSAANTTLYDLRQKWVDHPGRFPVKAGSSLYHERPVPWNYYCLYRKRDGESHPLSEDCGNISEIITAHAQQLASSGVQFMMFDQTNLCQLDPYTDWLQNRPTELIFEEFASLRARGIRTPLLAHWNRMDKDCHSWQPYLDLYNKYPDLVYKHPTTGKFMFFAPHLSAESPDAELITKVKSNGGRNNVEVVKIWAFVSQQDLQAGVWTFFAPCRTSDGRYTVDVLNDVPCNQDITHNSPLGSQTSLSFSYQTYYGSLPFAASGKMGGLTFMKQVERVLRDKPDHILLPSFNEHSAIAFPTPEGDGGKNTWSLGLENDPQRNSVFVDTYGAERSRSFHPTAESGDTYYKLMQSCVRVLSLMRYLNGTTCQVQGEICCDSSLHQFTPVWALDAPSRGDTLLTTTKLEVTTLVQRGWKERCVPPFGTTTLFCVEGIQHSFDAHRGPFLVHGNRTAPGWTSSAMRIPRAPLYRCITTNGLHFVSNGQSCEGLGRAEYLIGYVATAPSSLFARSLRRCKDTKNVYYHALDSHCEDNSLGQLIGFVF